MNKSAAFSRYEFDYQADFTQFLEEAKKSSCQSTLNTPHFEASGEKQLNCDKKNKKSWKNSLFSWFKIDKKGKISTNQPMNGKNVSKQMRGHVSGPVQGTIGGNITIGRAQRRPVSGPLTGVFSSKNGAEEYEVPYMCLGQINDPQKLHHSYGPVYLVT